LGLIRGLLLCFSLIAFGIGGFFFFLPNLCANFGQIPSEALVVYSSHAAHWSALPKKPQERKTDTSLCAITPSSFWLTHILLYQK
jgi:hypothetical protein